MFVWGYGLLGKGPNLEESKFPQQIPQNLFGLSDFNEDITVADIQCGLFHFAAFTSELIVLSVLYYQINLDYSFSNCFAFVHARTHRLGHAFLRNPFKYLHLFPDEGHLYTWGKNMRGCLGLGNLKDQHFPLKVRL